MKYFQFNSIIFLLRGVYFDSRFFSLRYVNRIKRQSCIVILNGTMLREDLRSASPCLHFQAIYIFLSHWKCFPVMMDQLSLN